MYMWCNLGTQYGIDQDVLDHRITLIAGKLLVRIQSYTPIFSRVLYASFRNTTQSTSNLLLVMCQRLGP